MRTLSIVPFWLVIMLGLPGAFQAQEVQFRDCYVIKAVGQYGRAVVYTDAIQSQITRGTWKAPSAGDKIELPDGTERVWEKAVADRDGWFSGEALQSGYAFVSYRSDNEKAAILDAAGHTMVYVNGEPRIGDTYSHHTVKIPILLKKGMNEFLFSVSRGRFRAKLVPPVSSAYIDLSDTTLPDLVEGENGELLAAVVVGNASPRPLEGVTLEARNASDIAVHTYLPPIPAFGVRKVAFTLPSTMGRGDSAEFRLQLLRLQQEAEEEQAISPEAKITLRVRKPGQSFRCTFESAIDGSAQYYAVVPPQLNVGLRPAPGLILTLHGAGVEAQGQADCYAPKEWAYVIAATNRRPFGFDWEDWGRLDALEVLEDAQKRFRTDPRKTWLTGHSMGGHGTWQLGAQYPDKFAAIGPSAGWISFWSYVGGTAYDTKDPIGGILQRAVSPSDTLSLKGNYDAQSIYVLHGDKDDNVPVEQAREMKSQLEKSHPDFHYFEQPGAGHWWDGDKSPGTDCVDWPPMLELFQRRTIPTAAEASRVKFVTASPGVSARCHWVTILQQTQQWSLSSVDFSCDSSKMEISGTTHNVALLKLDLAHLPARSPLSLILDGKRFENPGGIPRVAPLYFQKQDSDWKLVDKPPKGWKGPDRYGGLKDVFRHRPVLVYGTNGTPDENAWALMKARYDAEAFWYRGNGSLDVIADTEFNPQETNDRSVVLYGNADTNAAWRALLRRSPAQVRSGAVKVGDKELKGDDLAALFILPREGSDIASVGVVAGTGLVGMRAASRLPYFLSGVAYPDCLILGADFLEKGLFGIRCAGFFGLDWSIEAGDFAWRD